MQFEITPAQHELVEAWLEREIYPKAIRRQKDKPLFQNMDVAHPDWEAGHPYGGAMGGGVTYCFTPTDLGVGVSVTENWTGQSLNITDYSQW